MRQPVFSPFKRIFPALFAGIPLLMVLISCKPDRHLSSPVSHKVPATQATTTDKIQGAWYEGRGYEPCRIAFADSFCWLNNDFAYRYTYKIEGNSITIYNEKTHKMFKNITFSFSKDTLVLKGINEYAEASERLIPYKTILVHGKRVKLPDQNLLDPELDTEWEKLFNRLEKDPLSEATLNEWNNLHAFTDGCFSENADTRLADLYLKHPATFLHYIYHFPSEGQNHIESIIFGGAEEVVGYPSLKRVLQDIEKLSDHKEVESLKQKYKLATQTE